MSLGIFLSAAATTALWGQSRALEWIHADLYPFVITSGADKGQGAADLAMDLLDQELKLASPLRLIMPNSRIAEELKRGRHALWPTATRNPDRETYLFFSLPYAMIYPPIIIAPPSLGLPSQLSPSHLPGLTGARVILVRGRNYGSRIQGLVDSIPENQRVYLSNLKDEFSRVVELMASGRPVFLLGYAEEVVALISETGTRDLGWTYSLLPGASMVEVSIAAPMNDWGAALIDRINVAIPSLRMKVAERYGRYLPEEGLAEYLSLVKTRFEP